MVVFKSIILLASFFAVSTFVYDFSHPEILELPKALHEISGITVVDQETFAAVQDEHGIIYILDDSGKITDQIPFAGSGDFEGIAYVKKEFYTLRSDGKLFKISHWKNPKKLVVDSFDTHIPNLNNEGFCYDQQNNALLIGSKSKRSNDKADKNLRSIYVFNLDKATIDTTKTIQLDVKNILRFARTNQMELHQIPSKKDSLRLQPNLKIKISGMYVHPVTQELYVLSAGDYYLFILDTTRSMKSIYALPPKFYNKSEGIAIRNNGDMFISNEGQHNHPTLLRLLPKR